MPLECRAPQYLGAIQVPGPGDRTGTARERVGAVRESRQHRVVQCLGRRRLARPGQHLGVGHHDVGIAGLDPPQPDEALQRTDQLAVPAVEDRESVQGPLVGRVGGEDALVARAGGGVRSTLECLVGRGQLRRQRTREERNTERQDDVPRHHDPHTSRIAS